MERNEDQAQGYGETSSPGGSNTSSSGSYGGSNDAPGGASYNAGASNASSDVDQTSKLQAGKDALADKLGTVKDKASDLKDKASDLASRTASKASDLKVSLADKLDAGAEALRNRSTTGALAGATGESTAAIPDTRMTQLNDALAGGMESTANFLRDGDLQAAVEEQVKNHPARTLLIAAGVGYLLGKAIRR